MASDRAQTTRGYVLHVAGYGETDKLVTLYSEDLGRFTAIAKGALKSKQRFVNKLEPYSLLGLFYLPPRTASGLYFLEEAELLAANLPLRHDHQRYIVASHYVELILRFTREHDPDPTLYSLIAWTLEALSMSPSPLQVAIFSLVHLLDALGYRPDLQACGRCHQLVSAPHSYTLIPGHGALLCNSCQPHASPLPSLSVQTLRTLAAAQTTPLDRLARLHISPQGMAEAFHALHSYTIHLLQRDIHSWPLLRQLLSPMSNKSR